MLDKLAHDIGALVTAGIQIGIVVGGGNLFRGEALSESGLDRVTGDHMGMLATIMNALAMQDAFERAGYHTRVMSSFPLDSVCEKYDHRQAVRYLQSGRLVIFSGGTGNPFFTTDTAACLRGIEIDAQLVLKATKVDGVFSADPVSHPDAEFYPRLSFLDVLQKQLKVMDLTAMCLCREHNMPLRIFNIYKQGALRSILYGGDEGTLVSN